MKEMKETRDYTFIVNLGIHVLILFTILNLFFWLYVSKIEKKLLKDQVDSFVSNVPSVLSQLNEKFKPDNLFKAKLREKMTKVMAENTGEDPEMISNNKKLLVRSFISVFIIFILLVVGIQYIKHNKGGYIDFGLIFKENLFIFFFVGIIEFLFFKNIAIKYTPVNQSFVIDTIIDKIQEKYIST